MRHLTLTITALVGVAYGTKDLAGPSAGFRISSSQVPNTDNEGRWPSAQAAGTRQERAAPLRLEPGRSQFRWQGCLAVAWWRCFPTVQTVSEHKKKGLSGPCLP